MLTMSHKELNNLVLNITRAITTIIIIMSMTQISIMWTLMFLDRVLEEMLVMNITVNIDSLSWYMRNNHNYIIKLTILSLSVQLVHYLLLPISYSNPYITLNKPSRYKNSMLLIPLILKRILKLHIKVV